MIRASCVITCCFFLQAEDGIRYLYVTGVQTCALPIVRDFAAARRFVATLKEKGKLDEAALAGFARQKKYEETVVALAELSHTTIEVIRPLMQSLRDDGLVVACRATKLSWETTAAVLECRYSTGSVGAAELTKAKSHFNGTTIEHARRMLSFWQVRSTAAPSWTN